MANTPESKNSVSSEYQKLAATLFEEKAVLIDISAGGGFSLKLHEGNPSAQRSPIKFNIRPPGYKGGTVSNRLYERIGFALAREAVRSHLDAPDVVVGVPTAGDMLVDSMLPHIPTILHKECARVKLTKTEGWGSRRITGLRGFEGMFFGETHNTAWLIDDLVTGANSKIEALDIIRAAGFKVPVCLVLIDREQGGKEQLASYGVQLKSVFTMKWLVQFYFNEHFVTNEQYNAIMAYIEQY